ncbi:hypothetical protein MTP99_007579 [Tenebrio molitor]|nr:hypothetical protein MTP99_007579 [Tenebrio molitor]
MPFGLLGAGLTLKEFKCEFCKPELHYLRYVVNRRGLNVDPAKVSAVVDMPQSKGVRDYPNLRVRDGHVFKRVKRRDGEFDPEWKWVVPKGSRDELLKRYHDDTATSGHLCVYKTYHKIHNNHTWPRTRADVCRYVKRRPVCASVKSEPRSPAETMGSRPKVRERSRTGSRTPTSGTGRDKFARVGAKDIKGGTDAILEVHGSRPIPCVCVCAQRGEIRGCFPSATGVGETVEEDRNGWKNRPEGAPTVRCGGSRLLPRGSTTLGFSGSYFATLLGRSYPPGSHQKAGPHTGQPSAEDPESQEP